MALRGNGVGTAAGMQTPFYPNDGLAAMPFWISLWHCCDTLPPNVRSYPFALLGGLHTVIYLQQDALSGASPPINGIKWNITDESNTAIPGSPGPFDNVGQWRHTVIQFLAAGTARIYYDGVYSSGIYTVPNGLPIDRMTFGPDIHAAELLAEIAVGTGVVSGGQVASLASGRNPMTETDPDRLIRYFPLRDSFQDFGRVRRGSAPNANAPLQKWGPHPPVAPPPMDMLWLTASYAGGGGGVVVTNRPRILIAA